ncbi:E3 ubiquitin protein ligase ATL4-like protein [Tanacetum coccineum]
MDLTAPPPPPLLTTATDTINDIVLQQQQKQHSSHESTTSTSSSIIIVVIVISSAILVSAAIYLILRYFSRRCSREAASAQRAFSTRDFVFGQNEAQHQHVIRMDNGNNKNETMSLPMFTFSSITGNIAGASGDCAVCLSKFEPVDKLRLLPLCYHAFHVECIDAWLKSNQTCPLCRASVSPSEADVLNTVHHLRDTNGTDERENNVSRNNSFRIEIGSVSWRTDTPTDVSSDRRSYSVGEYEYILDDGYEVPVESTVTHRRNVSVVDKDSYAPSAPPVPPGYNLTAEIGNGSARINWLRDYVDRVSVSISSRSQSFRSSGRFFTGSSRRSEVVDNFEATHNRVGEEISELFRWLSGV